MEAIEHYLRSEGRRRFPAARLVGFTPLVGGLTLAALWIAIVVNGQAPGLLLAFGSLLTVGSLAAAVVGTRALLRRDDELGHQGAWFREGTRADFRAAVLNIRAGVITGIAGAVLGAVVLAGVQKLFGIDLS